MRTPIVALLGVAVGLAIGSGAGVVLSSSDPVVHETVERVEVTNVTEIETHVYRGEVQSLRIAGQTVAVRSEGGEMTKPGHYHKPTINKTLIVHLSASGGTARASWDAPECEASNCTFTLDTDEGVTAREQIHDPVREWEWVVRAEETTMNPVSYRMRVTWAETWQEEAD